MLVKFKIVIITLLQVVLISLIWLLSDWLYRHWLEFIPSNLLALFIILVIVSMYENAIVLFDKGAYFLILHIPLLFIPIVVVTVKHREFFLTEGLNILLVMCLSSIITMLVVVQVVYYVVGLLRQKKG